MLKQQNPSMMTKIEFYNLKSIELTFKKECKDIITEFLSYQYLYIQNTPLNFNEFSTEIQLFMGKCYGHISGGGISIGELTSLYTIYEIKTKLILN